LSESARIGLYVADQHWPRTLSKGIYAYSRTLAHELVARARRPPVLIVNRANRADMRRSAGEAEEVVLPTASATGLARLAADHVVAPFIGRTRGLGLLHFPKGFVPAWGGGVRVSATIHDLIPLHYAEHHPGYFRRGKLAYLRWAVLNTLRRARGVMTDSRFSADALRGLAGSAGLTPPPIEVVYLVPDPALVEGEANVRGDPTRLLHLGSVLPHKRTRETIAAFRAWNAGHGGTFRLSVTGLAELPPAWAVAPGRDLELAGTVDVRGLRELMAGSRALLLLSSIEGFGLPAVEAWSLGTPVCFRRAGSLPEVLADMPGGCDGDADFAAALDEVLALAPRERGALQARVRARFDLATFGRTAVDLLERWAGE
jgi:glycosyltransferase involved in cell wall biosynthesis